MSSNTTSSSSSSSTTSLLSKSKRQTTTPKDYESSFGNLSSQYGFGGILNLPSIPRKSTKSKSTTKPSLSSTSSQSKKSGSTSVRQSSSTSNGSQPQKDWESAFGQLSSSYGFGGGFSVPTSTKH